MGNNWARMIATGFIWGAFTLVAVAALMRDVSIDGGPLVLIAAFMIGGTVAATNFIWNGSGSERAAIEAEKSKRSGRVDRVLEKMSGAELAELRARLMADYDGEAVSLDELLAERSGRR